MKTVPRCLLPERFSWKSARLLDEMPGQKIESILSAAEHCSLHTAAAWVLEGTFFT
jgi:hypothetical protein